MEWQDEHEDLLRIWLTQAFYDKKMHGHASVFYTNVYYWGGGISVSLTAITSAAVFLQFSNMYGHTMWGFAIVALLSLLSAVTAAAMQFLNPQRIATEHTRAENLYNSFIVEVNTVIAYRRSNREPVTVFMARARTQLQMLPLACPNIPTHISKLYIKKTRKKMPTLDDIVIGDSDTKRQPTGQEAIVEREQDDIESALVTEANTTGNMALYRFLAEKSNILNSSETDIQN